MKSIAATVSQHSLANDAISATICKLCLSWYKADDCGNYAVESLNCVMHTYSLLEDKHLKMKTTDKIEQCDLSSSMHGILSMIHAMDASFRTPEDSCENITANHILPWCLKTLFDSSISNNYHAVHVLELAVSFLTEAKASNDALRSLSKCLSEIENRSSSDVPDNAFKADGAIVDKLIYRGYTRNGACRAALMTKNESASAALLWAVTHAGDANFDEPIAVLRRENDSANNVVPNEGAIRVATIILARAIHYLGHKDNQTPTGNSPITGPVTAHFPVQKTGERSPITLKETGKKKPHIIDVSVVPSINTDHYSVAEKSHHRPKTRMIVVPTKIKVDSSQPEKKKLVEGGRQLLMRQRGHLRRNQRSKLAAEGRRILDEAKGRGRSTNSCRSIESAGSGISSFTWNEREICILDSPQDEESQSGIIQTEFPASKEYQYSANIATGPKSLQEELSRIKTEGSSEVRLRIEAKKEAARLQSGKEVRLRIQAEEEAARLQAEEEERLRLQHHQEEEHLRIEAEEAEAARMKQQEQEKEQERLRIEAKDAEERLRIQAEAAEAARLQHQEEETRLRIEAEETESARLQQQQEEERLRFEAETTRLKQEEEERLRMEAEAAETARLQQQEQEDQRLRIEAEEAGAARLKHQQEEEQHLRIEAERAEAARLKQEEEERLQIKAEEADAAKLLQLQEEERLRIVAERAEATRLKQKEEERLHIEAEAAAASTLQQQHDEERLRIEAEEAEATRLQQQEEQARLRIEAEEAEAARCLQQQEEESLHIDTEAARLQHQEEEERLRVETEAAEDTRLKEEEFLRIEAEAEAADAAKLQLQQEEEHLRIMAEEAEATRLKQEEEELLRIEAEAAEAARFLQQQEEERVRIEVEEAEAAKLQRQEEEERLLIEAEAEESARLHHQDQEEERLLIEAEEAEITRLKQHEDEKRQRIEAEASEAESARFLQHQEEDRLHMEAEEIVADTLQQEEAGRLRDEAVMEAAAIEVSDLKKDDSISLDDFVDDDGWGFDPECSHELNEDAITSEPSPTGTVLRSGRVLELSTETVQTSSHIYSKPNFGTEAGKVLNSGTVLHTTKHQDEPSESQGNGSNGDWSFEDVAAEADITDSGEGEGEDDGWGFDF